jgi:hypothetical protein
VEAVKKGENCGSHRVGDKCNTNREVASNRPDIIIENETYKRFVMIYVAVLAERNTT